MGNANKTRLNKTRKDKNNVSAFEIFRLATGIKKSYMPLVILEQMLSSSVLYINIILGAKILDYIADAIATPGNTAKAEQEITRLALFMVILTFFLSLTWCITNKYLIVLRREIDESVLNRISVKCLVLDYQILEKAGTLDYIEKAEASSHSNGGITSYCSNISNITGHIISIIYASVILASLFTSNGNGDIIIVLFVIAISIFIRFLIHKKANQMQYSMFEENITSNRRYGAYFNFLYDYKTGKQERIYNMADMVLNGARREAGNIIKLIKKMFFKELFLSALTEAIINLLLFTFYIYTGLNAANGSISTGSIVLYAGTLAALSNNISDFSGIVNNLHIMHQYIGNYISFLSLENEKYEGTIPVEKRLDNDYELEFKNVSFHYPNNPELILKNITAKIKAGHKMAIAGRNGSGKSTFIKLLLRLYDPSEGEILLNGVDIRKYNYDEYRQIFGVVFQDFQLFPLTIAQNVAASTQYSEQRIWHVLGQAGIAGHIKNMEKGIGTVIYNQDEEGVEISGGEAQKLAIARALYRNAPVVILDEPTAALDPASELEIYERFDEMTSQKTAIYISHRMSSCRFCENILVFDNGNILEMGSHEKLIADGGLYKSLWDAQAQYYSTSGK
ncbi:MAG: ABC transporter ATP-binding protein [Lachnospiraceae bacterium]|nr:ABC transporter ATP-binding protein [Lachnospiraceae bacterium]